MRNTYLQVFSSGLGRRMNIRECDTLLPDMTVGQWITASSAKLKEAGTVTAQLDVEVLLSDAIQKDRSWLHAHAEVHISNLCSRADLDQLDSQMERRVQHEPLAYIRGKQEFFGREFYVSPDTLTPRPETETMIELLIERWRNDWQAGSKDELQVIDIGTGSGCIIITVALEMSKRKTHTLTTESKYSYIGLDISKPALEVARKNTVKHGVDVDFRIFDLHKDNLHSVIDVRSTCIFLANLPYVPNDFKINLAASKEPAFAIYGGVDGLDYYRALFKGLSQESGARSQGTVFTESMPPQHQKLTKIAKKAGFRLQKTQDFIQVFKPA